jgi:ribonuclease BN (tRNA processing enzyme)
MAQLHHQDFSMQLLPLGTCAANRTSYQDYSGYLLKFGDATTQYQILLDCGSKRVLDFDQVDPKRLKVIILSHSHLDHTHYIGKLIQKLVSYGRVALLTIIAHPNTIKVVNKIIKLWNQRKIPEFVRFTPIKLTIHDPYLRNPKKKCQTDLTQVANLDPISFDLGNNHAIKMQISATPALHTTSSIATKLEFDFTDPQQQEQWKKVNLVYSPDTSFKSDYLVEFAQNADYWLLDTTYHRAILDKAYEKYLKKKWRGEIHGHSSPEYSAMLCEKAKVKHYVIIHYFWKRFTKNFNEIEPTLLKLAGQFYHGNIIVTKELVPIELRVM